MNTELRYMYRDGSNYTFYGEAIFEGELTEVERVEFSDALQGGDSFIPDQVGLESVRPGGTYADDGIWHEFLEWESTNRPATEGSVHEFITLFTSITWDEDAAEADMLAPFLQRVNATGIITIGSATLYEKCAGCLLFIDLNNQQGDGIAAYVHLMSDNRPGDTELDESHEPAPSGQLATLSVWRMYGPSDMRTRFDTDKESD